MLFLLSPAKTLDYDSPLQTQLFSEPLFVEESAQLIRALKPKSAPEIAKLMSISPALAELNVARYAQWTSKSTHRNARPAVLTFDGDVYEGLQAQTLKEKDLEWAQEHLAILSGLYGVLRPLDLMQPYRLEMGTKLANAKGKNLYDYWKTVVAPYLNQRLSQDKQPVVVNLASEEYFKAVDTKALKARVIQCIFKDGKAGAFKIVSFYAKRARGLMARFAIEQRAQTPEALQAFNSEGYVYQPTLSTPDTLVFHRS